MSETGIIVGIGCILFVTCMFACHCYNVIDSSCCRSREDP